MAICSSREDFRGILLYSLNNWFFNDISLGIIVLLGELSEDSFSNLIKIRWFWLISVLSLIMRFGLGSVLGIWTEQASSTPFLWIQMHLVHRNMFWLYITTNSFLRFCVMYVFFVNPFYSLDTCASEVLLIFATAQTDVLWLLHWIGVLK